MTVAPAVLMLTMGIVAAEPTASDYGRLHYLYASAIGDQGCADLKVHGSHKRHFEARYAGRVRVADHGFKVHYRAPVLSDALVDAYGGPDTIDTRDCLMTSTGEPAFRDTTLFIAKLRSIEDAMRSVR